MTDVIDQGNDEAAQFLESSLSAQRQRQITNPAHSEASICQGCKYVTKSSYGKSCEAWAECLEDVAKTTRQKEIGIGIYR